MSWNPQRMLGFGRRLLRSPSSIASATRQRRGAYRVEVRFPVRFVAPDGLTKRGEVQDLSAGGVALACEEDMVVGAPVALKFELPEGLLAGVRVETAIETGPPYKRRTSRMLVPPAPFAPVAAGARVVTRTDAGNRRFVYGLQFVGLTDTQREEFHRFIHLWQLRRLKVRPTQ